MKATVFLASLVAAAFFWGNHPARFSSTHNAFPAAKAVKAKASASLPVSPVRIVIDKSDYELHVYDARGWYATYPVVFGNNPLADKKMEGDKLTPEGNYRVVAKRPHQKWSRFLALDYPNPEDLARFEARKRRGEIPRNASPGGGIGIHGTWPRDEYMIDRFKNWTNGCISLKNGDVQELYGYIPVGTPVIIRR